MNTLIKSFSGVMVVLTMLSATCHSSGESVTLSPFPVTDVLDEAAFGAFADIESVMQEGRWNGAIRVQVTDLGSEERKSSMQRFVVLYGREGTAEDGARVRLVGWTESGGKETRRFDELLSVDRSNGLLRSIDQTEFFSLPAAAINRGGDPAVGNIQVVGEERRKGESTRVFRIAEVSVPASALIEQLAKAVNGGKSKD